MPGPRLGELKGEIQFDANTDERAGPLDIGVALTAAAPSEEAAADASGTPPHEQRVIVTGDGDFLSNTYLGNAGNLDLGLNMVHWLSHDDAFIDIRVKPAPDTTLELEPGHPGRHRPRLPDRPAAAAADQRCW